MKLSQKERNNLNNFVSTYIDMMFKHDLNVVHLSKADSYSHNRMVFEICWWLLKNNIPFITQTRFRTGYRPDIIVPINHIKKIIEVRNTETDKDTVAKMHNIPTELRDEIIYVNANQEFKKELIL